MAKVEIELHARQRMAERNVSVEDIAYVWLHCEEDWPSKDHTGFRVRSGRVPDGRIVTVVGRLTLAHFRVKTVWVA
jgi:hypothetical protein